MRQITDSIRQNIWGYAHFFTDGNDVRDQIKQLEQAGCDVVFTDISADYRAKRLNREKLINQLKHGDSLFITQIHRLGFDRADLITAINQILSAGVNISCTDEEFELKPGSPMSLLALIRSLPVVEQTWKLERFGGTPVELDESELLMIGKMMYIDGMSVAAISKELEISQQTIKFNENKISRVCFEVWGSYRHQHQRITSQL